MDGWRRRRLWILAPPAALVQHWCQDGAVGAFRGSVAFRPDPRSEHHEYGTVSIGPDWIQASVAWRKGS